MSGSVFKVPVMGPPQWSGLGLLLCASTLLLALPKSARSQGEFCHHWMDSAQVLHGGFQCPEGYDTPTATLCCGTCFLRYCCAAPEGRLDQAQCPETVPWDSEEAVLAPPEGSIYLPWVIVGGTFFMFIILGILAGIACFRCFWSWKRKKVCTVPQSVEPAMQISSPNSRINDSEGQLLHSKPSEPSVNSVLHFTAQEYPNTILTIPTSVGRPLHWPVPGPPQISSLTPSTAIVLAPAPLSTGTISYGPTSALHPPGTSFQDPLLYPEARC
ncbi:protein shisa-1-like [Ochotona princeps]|uniref:protein shisa-1-like n=1 Tax=Ochotona princeps TaxID=9978 RepID=UPI002714C45E|nr:protein shisa-1-like [Ochotona princeps]